MPLRRSLKLVLYLCSEDWEEISRHDLIRNLQPFCNDFDIWKISIMERKINKLSLLSDAKMIKSIHRKDHISRQRSDFVVGSNNTCYNKTLFLRYIISTTLF